MNEAFEKHGMKAYFVSLLLVIPCMILQLIGLAWVLLLIAGNIKLLYLRMFGFGLNQKITKYTLPIFNILWVAWTIEFLTGFFSSIGFFS